MDRMTQFYIGGEWVAPVSGETMPVMNPANGERLGTVALGNAEDVDRAVAAATAAFDSFSLGNAHGNGCADHLFPRDAGRRRHRAS